MQSNIQLIPKKSKLKQKITLDMKEIITFCVENKLDMLGVYKLFNAKNYKEFKAFIEKVGIEDFLSNIKFETNVKINRAMPPRITDNPAA